MFRPSGPISQDIPGILRWLMGIHTLISQEFEAPRDSIRLKALTVEPTRIYEDMVVRADGVHWSPGGGGAGIYAWVSGAWVKLN